MPQPDLRSRLLCGPHVRRCGPATLLRRYVGMGRSDLEAGALGDAPMTASGAALALRRRNLLAAWILSRACAIPIALHVVYGEDISTHILAAIMLYTIAEHCSLRVAVAGLLAEYGLITVNVF